MRIIGKTAGTRAWTCTILAAAASLATQATAQELRWKFSPGKKLQYNMVQDMTMGTEGGPLGAQSVTMRQEMVMRWEVEGVNEAGEAVINQRFDQMKMKMTLPGLGDIEYDSKSEEPPAGPAAMIAPMYKILTEAEFELTMTPRGEIKEVKIPDDVLTALKKSPGAAQLGDMATPEGFKRMISQGALVFPENGPKEGEEWKTKVEVKNQLGVKQIIETTYRYEGTRDVDGVKYAVFRPTLNMSFEGTPQVQMNVTKQESSGEVLFNIEEGRLHSSKLKQDATVSITAAGQVLQQHIDQAIDVSVKPVAEGSDEASAESEEPAESGAPNGEE